MPSKKASVTPHIIRHKNGSLWAKGGMLGKQCHGYWEWFRKDGTLMRSGNFARGVQTGEWITYDREGKKFKVTQIKPAKKAAEK